MSRSCLARKPWALMGFLTLAAGCQSYNFNPVGSCMLQPGRTQFTLSDISTADVLFVVDDSNSMSAEQTALSQNFDAYINNLDDANGARVTSGLEPFDFHIAVTTTSVFYNPTANATCSTCGGSALVCCGNTSGQPLKQPRKCASDGDCVAGMTGATCATDCNGLKGEKFCCQHNVVSAGNNPPPLVDLMTCSLDGRACGVMQEHFGSNLSSCVAGVATPEYPYARGDFVSVGTNPRVLHFDKSLYPNPPDLNAKNRQGYTRDNLRAFFSSNVIVGTCGSGQEQALAASRLALEKAFTGRQKDTQLVNGSDTAEWPHDKSQLVLVFVGDEDDCSTPEDPSGGVVIMDPAITPVSGAPGLDACVKDTAKLNQIASQYVDFFLGAGRPVVAAFIEAALETQCGYGSLGACTPGQCCQSQCAANIPAACTPIPPPPTSFCAGPGYTLAQTSTTCCGALQCDTGNYPYYCGGQAPATRLFEAASQLKGREAKVFTGSICDSNFRAILDEIGKLSIPPTTLTLPTTPASSEITVLRIIAKDGKTTRRFCGTPAPACTGCTPTAEWWFTLTKDAGDPVSVSQHVYINPAGACKLNPGETYSAEYIGRLPEDGCVTEADCKTELQGTGDCSSVDSTSCSYTCYAGTHDSGGVNKCVPPTASSRGTCICGAPAKNCPNGKG